MKSYNKVYILYRNLISFVIHNVTKTWEGEAGISEVGQLLTTLAWNYSHFVGQTFLHCKGSQDIQKNPC